MFRPRFTPDEDPIDPGKLIRLARVISVDLEEATIIARSGDVESHPIPFACWRSGHTRTWSPPSEDEQVLLICPQGDLEGAFALAALPQDVFPPAGNSLRELIIFRDEATLAYDPQNHHLDIDLPSGATLAIRAKGGVSIHGDVTVTGKLTASDDVVGAGVSLKSHKHGGVQTGPGLSGMPL